jgi:hypothetical protein
MQMVHSRKCGVLVAVAALALAAPAGAQSPEDLQRWAAINAAAPPPSASVARAAIVAAQADCPAAGASLGVIEPVTAWPRVDAAITSGQLVNAWAVTLQRVDCPQPFARYILLQDASGTLSAQMVHIGRSHVDLDSMAGGVMTKAMRTAAAAAARDIPGCSAELVARTGALARIDMIDDSAIGPDRYGLRNSGAWREAWVFGICGRTLTVMMDFEGTPEGLKATPAPWASLAR